MVIGVLPLSCSYMKPVVEVINEQKASCRPCDHKDVICTLPLIILCFDYVQLKSCANNGN